MIGAFFRKIIGSRNDRELKRLAPLVEQVNAQEDSIHCLSDNALKEKTVTFRQRLLEGAPDDVELSERFLSLLPEAFAVAREAARRTLSMRPFDVQILGGIALHIGKIAEMKTGEGKTLMSTLPVYLNALLGRGVHVVTVNDYLAKRDAQWMGEMYKFLGLSVGVIQHDMPDAERRQAYHSDITYGTNNEFGFDYLRDNMKFNPKECVQRDLHYAIVDEVDSILIDEARTPLIISGPAEESTQEYYRVNSMIPSLKKERDYTLDEKSRTVTLTEEGNARVEKLLGVENLYDPAYMNLVHHTLAALKAHTLFRKDVDYMVQNGEVVIVDEFTGRLMPGRRWSDGLHQAVEAKEGVKIANENQTLASITFQNYFRMYKKIGGMTGTADTEASEFSNIYNLEVLVIPPNRPMIRQDDADQIYRTEKEKFSAIVDEVRQLHEEGHPVLVGTVSIEKSEHLSTLLKREGIPHTVLNAKYHEKEAEIIAQAGRFGAVTIATNMAGRGTDILLGGNPDFLFRNYLEQHPDADEATLNTVRDAIRNASAEEKARVIALGGLRIIGTERHESRRIDNQLRGRSGRQGDPGSARFYLSLEDDLLRIFGAERISKIMLKLGMEEGVPIEHRMVTRAIENAQKQVEAHHFDIRKHLLEYDDVMNKQRTLIYRLRHDVFLEPIEEQIQGAIDEIIDENLSSYCPDKTYVEEWDMEGLATILSNTFNIPFSKEGLILEDRSLLREHVVKEVMAAYQKKGVDLGQEVFCDGQRRILLGIIDTQWKDHLLSMDSLKEGVGLRGYGQKEPLSEYKREGFELFSAMIDRIWQGAVEHIFRIQAISPARREMPAPRKVPVMQMNRGETAKPVTVHRQEKKIGRNDLCSCGSGKKYKKCCGR